MGNILHDGQYLTDHMHVQLLHGGDAVKAHSERTRAEQWLVCIQCLHLLLISFPSLLQHIFICTKYAYPQNVLCMLWRYDMSMHSLNVLKMTAHKSMTSDTKAAQPVL